MKNSNSYGVDPDSTRLKLYISDGYRNGFLKIVLHESGSVIWANICSNYCNRFCGLDNDKYTKFQPIENCGLRACIESLRFQQIFCTFRSPILKFAAWILNLIKNEKTGIG